MTRRITLALAAVCALLAGGLPLPAACPGDAAAVPAVGARHPALSPDARLLAFDWRGDIWMVPAEGGAARRLTDHVAHESFPRWSPDGREIAFSGDRHGADDIFVVGLDGGAPERLTFHSDWDRIYDWSADGASLYFGGRREARFNLILAVPRAGGLPVRVTHDRAYNVAVSPDGKWLAYVRGYTNWWRKGYRGPASRDIWVRAMEGGPSHHVVAWKGNDDDPCWSGDGRALFFTSERDDGIANLWRQDLAFTGDRVDPAGPPVQLTRLDEDGIQFLDVSRDGSLAAFEWRGGIWTVPTRGGEPRRVVIDCSGDLKRNPVTRRVLSRGATEFAFAPGEEQVAFVVEGELYAALVEDGELKDPVRLTETDAREKDLAWLGENELLYASDRHGSDDIFLLRSVDPDEPRLGRSRYREEVRLTDSDETERQPLVSPDGETVLYRRDVRFLWVMNPDGGGQRLLLDQPGILHCDWSPDSRYVALSYTTLGSAEDIFILDVEEGGEPVNVSNHPNDDFHPLWTGDGKRLSWASRTDDGFYHIKYLWLTWEEADKTDAEREREEETAAKDDGDEEEAAPVAVSIDWEDYADRTRTVCTVRGYYWDYDQSPDGKHYALRTDVVEDMELWTVDWDGSRLIRLTRGGANPDRMRWSEDSESVRYLSDGRIQSIKNEDGAHPETLSFSVALTVDERARRLQKYREAWRLLDDGFYDANFHGTDWETVRAKYEPLAAEAVMIDDFNDILREMIGELNASHLGVWGGPRPGRGDDRTGQLGFTPDDDYDGPGVRVEEVLPRGPLDREGRRVKPGEVILAIDGRAIAPRENYYPLLDHKAGEEVDLRVAADGSGKDARTITVTPLASVYRLAQKHWVEENRRLVDRLSGGRLGYVYMSAMGDGNWDTFLEDVFSRAMGKEGLILDVRWNNGGHIHDQVLTFLSRRAYGYTQGRDDREPTFDATQRWEGPVVLLINERSYSDGEIFPMGFKALGLGRVVGMPTFGAVIGTSNTQLIDGTTFRIPGSGWYRLDGRNLENDPVTPDVLVPEVPEEALQGRNAQIEAGVAECLRMLDGS